MFYGLARSFAAASDRSFSSVPTQTDVNRAFSVCGTSLGGLDNGDVHVYDTPTFLDALTGRKTSALYWQFDGSAASIPARPGVLHRRPVPLDPTRHRRGTSSATCGPTTSSSSMPARGAAEVLYVEPHWRGGKEVPYGFVGLQGNDYHPPAWIGPAEHDLDALYAALRSSPQWPAHLLFVITFDEHGGTWDHVPPTATVAPDAHTERFGFERLGVRVPTILVTPWVTPGTVFRAPEGSAYDLDHTSFIATYLRWAGVDPETAGLGERVKVAPLFDGALSDTVHEPYLTDPPAFVVPKGYAEQGEEKRPIGLYLDGLDLTAATIQGFRHAVARSETVEELTERLRHLGAGPAGSAAPADPGE